MELGTADIEGDSLGCDVGQFETEGFSDGRRLGTVLIDGDSLGCDDGFVDKLGFSLG